MKMDELKQEIKRCRECGLHFSAKNAVPGEGPYDANIMLVGQNPGAREDESGRPFVGASGKYLNTVLMKNSLNRKKIFITSIVKHKTPKNRKPTSQEVGACLPYLIKQIEGIKPGEIVLMGKISQKTPKKKGIRYVETFHPAAAMRFPKMRRIFEEDMKQVERQ
ncbi:MAG: uracil-DNA glycosylase [Candidatus Altiarchaeales archaeon]|nr:uracil-DNA glycosylase [Candidatus Altiarchaeales archaeon]